jgi:hypothetical protein
MEPLGSLLHVVVPALVAKAPLTPEKVQFAWRVSVGSAIDRATRARLAGATLVVSGETQWLREVERSRDLILRRLQRILGPGVVGALDCDPNRYNR